MFFLLKNNSPFTFVLDGFLVLTVTTVCVYDATITSKGLEKLCWAVLSRSVMSNSLRPHGL